MLYHPRPIIFLLPILFSFYSSAFPHSVLFFHSPLLTPLTHKYIPHYCLISHITSKYSPISRSTFILALKPSCNTSFHSLVYSSPFQALQHFPDPQMLQINLSSSPFTSLQFDLKLNPFSSPNFSYSQFCLFNYFIY